MEGSVAVLVGLIILPILLVEVIAVPVLRRLIFIESGRVEPLRKIIYLNPDYGLTKQLLFWEAVLVPVIYFIEFGFFSWKGYDLSLTKSGFDEFISVSKLPIALASLSIPLTALVAKLHSTSQTAKQIALTTKQIKVVETKNNHDIFYSHRKEFVSFYDVVGELTWFGMYKTTYKIDPRIHARLFNGSPADGVPVLKYHYIDEMISKLRSAEKSLDSIIGGSEERLDEAHNSFIDFSRDIFYLIKLFGIKDLGEHLYSDRIVMPYYDVEGTRHVQFSAGTTTPQAIAAYSCVRSYLLSALEFAAYSKGIAEIKRDTLDYLFTADGFLARSSNGLILEKVVTRFRSSA